MPVGKVVVENDAQAPPPPKGGQRDSLRILNQGARAASMHVAALDALALGIAICDSGGRVAFTNTTADELLSQKRGLMLGSSGRELVASAPDDARAFARLLREAADDGCRGLIRLSGKNDAALLVVVAPLWCGLEDARGPGCVLVTMRAPDEPFPLIESMLVALFGLSSAQASIALSIFNGKSPDEIANERGNRISTLRTHLAEIFLRTGTENQRDLVRLLGTLPPLR
jgi:DNA-binding CsgD family transcriptional regulator